MTRLQAHLLLVFTAMIWGSTFVVQKTAFIGENATSETAIGPLFFTAVRFLLGALVVLPLALRERRRAPAPLSKGHALSFVTMGVILFTGAATQQIGIITTSVTNAGFLTALYVPMVPILALVLFRKWPRRVVWPAAAGCVGGAYLLNGGTFTAFSTGDQWVLFSVLFWSLHVTMVGIFVVRSGRPFALSFIQFVVSGVVGTGIALGFETIHIQGLQDIALEILYAGVISVGLAYTMQVVAQRHTHPASAAIIMSSEMLFAALFAAVILGERLGPIELAGGALILISAVSVEIAPFVKFRRGRKPTTESVS